MKPLVFTLASLCSYAQAQTNPVGDIAIGFAFNEVRLIHTAGTGSGLVDFGSNFIKPTLGAFEFDHRTGDLIVANRSTNGIELYRTTLSGATVVSQTLQFVIPNSSDLRPIHLYYESFGSYLVAATDDANSQWRLWRVGLNSTSGYAFEVPGASSIASMNSICSDVRGQIYVADASLGNCTSPIIPQCNRIWTLPPGGAAAPVPVTPDNFSFSLRAVETKRSGSLLSGGLQYSLINPINYRCENSLYNLASSAEIRGIHRILGSDDVLIATRGGSSVMSVARTSSQNCAAPPTLTTVFASAATGPINNVTQWMPGTKLYGSPSASSAGEVVRIEELSPPQLGSTWEVKMSGAPANQPAVFYIGGSDTVFNGVPLPIGLDPAGAPGAAWWTSSDIEVITASDSNGEATISTPGISGIAGTQLYCQWVVLDVGQNQLGFSFSGGLATEITL